MGFLPVEIPDGRGQYVYVVPEEVVIVRPYDATGTGCNIIFKSSFSIDVAIPAYDVIKALQGKRFFAM